MQYAAVAGLLVIALDAGAHKASFVKTLGAKHYIDITSTPDPVQRVRELVNGPGAHGVIVAAGAPAAYRHSAEMLRAGGVMSCCGIAPDMTRIETPAAQIVIKNLRIVGNLIGSARECAEAVEFVRRGVVKPVVKVREFEELGKIYEELERGEIEGRVVLKVFKDG